MAIEAMACKACRAPMDVITIIFGLFQRYPHLVRYASLVGR